MPGRVSKSERARAHRKLLDMAPIERRLAMTASRAALRVAPKVTGAFRRNQDPIQVMQRELRKLVPDITEAMVLGHLTGMRRTQLTVRPLSLAVTEAAEESLQRRLKLPDEYIADIASAYESQAVTVIGGIETHARKKLERAMLNITAQGMHVREGMEEIREAMVAAGVVPKAEDAPAYLLENIIRTQTAIAYNAGQWQSAQDPVIQNALWGYKYVTVGDDRVRPEHAGFDGMTLPKDDPTWNTVYPPCGFNCRCAAIEIFDQRENVPMRPTSEVDGKIYETSPDKGFDMNFGAVLNVPPPIMAT